VRTFSNIVSKGSSSTTNKGGSIMNLVRSRCQAIVEKEEKERVVAAIMKSKDSTKFADLNETSEAILFFD
jgi:hypothetical protein